jgi:L-serine dehydratase
MGLFGGLLGWDAADERLPGSMKTLADGGVRIRIETVDVGDPHPNTYRLTLTGSRGTMTIRAISTGGGMIEVIALDGFDVSLGGDAFTTLLWADSRGDRLRDELAVREEIDDVRVHTKVGDSPGQLLEIRSMAALPEALLAELGCRPGVTRLRTLGPVLPVLTSHGASVPFATAAELIAREGAAGASLSQLAIEYEMARGGPGASRLLSDARPRAASAARVGERFAAALEVGPIHRLRVVGRVPIVIIEDHGVSADEIQARAGGPRREEEGVNRGVGVEGVGEPRPVECRRAPVNP